jgi:membrane-bound metal-dependent hydrolase YbcI (DUF457 family)
VWVVGHGQVGWFLARGCGLQARDRRLVTVAAMVPDLDGLSILGGYDAYFQGHHVWLHSVFAAIAFAAGAAVLAERKAIVAGLAFLGVALHVLSDGLGLLAVMPLWPASRWVFWPSGGSLAVAAVGEIAVPAVLLAAQVALARREGISILELLPPRAEGWLRRRWRERFGGA